MPGGDRTGPMGAGPRTGRAAGYCAGYGMPGYANPYGGVGYGRDWAGGRGWGRGFRRGFGGMRRGAGGYGFEPPYYGGPVSAPAWGPGTIPPDAGSEVQDLKAQVKYYSALLRDLKKRLDEIEPTKDTAEC